MPNHLTTVCTVTGPSADIDTFVAAHFRAEDDGKRTFDFRTIVHQPEIVANSESGSQAENGFFALTGLHSVKFLAFGESPMHLAARHGRFPATSPMTTVEDYRAWLEKEDPESIRKGQIQLQCFRETGHMSWYDWDIANWGTKWNAYGYKERFREPQKLVFEFQTAWSFPRPIFEALGAIYAGLTFDVVTIDEGGPEYVGRYTNTSEAFDKVPEDAERYRLVYGRDPYSDDEEEETP